MPSGKEICGKQLFNLVEKVEKVEIDESQIDPFLDIIYKKLEWLNREDLIKKFVSVEFNRFLSYYKGAKDLNKVHDSRESRDSRGDRGSRGDRSSRQKKDRRSRNENQAEAGFSRLFINAGSTNGLNPTSLIGLINEQTKERNIDIGRIEIMKNFSFFEVDTAFEKKILSSLHNANFNDVSLVAELANPKQSKQDNRSSGNFNRKSNFKKRKDKGRKKGGRKY